MQSAVKTVNSVELNQFLQLARKEGWGNKDAIAKSAPGRFGFKLFEFKTERFLYEDIYSGNASFGGSEIIYSKGTSGVVTPLWMMSYDGAVLPELEEDPGGIERLYSILKDAMIAGEKQSEFYPRGPDRFREGTYKYETRWQGDIKCFQGSEKISRRFERREAVLYSGRFIGRLIQR